MMSTAVTCAYKMTIMHDCSESDSELHTVNFNHCCLLFLAWATVSAGKASQLESLFVWQIWSSPSLVSMLSGCVVCLNINIDNNKQQWRWQKQLLVGLAVFLQVRRIKDNWRSKAVLVNWRPQEWMRRLMWLISGVLESDIKYYCVLVCGMLTDSTAGHRGWKRNISAV